MAACPPAEALGKDEEFRMISLPSFSRVLYHITSFMHV